GCERQSFLHARCVGDETSYLFDGPKANLFFDFNARCVEIDSHFLEHVNCRALPEADESQQHVFSADESMLESLSFLAREPQYLLGSGCEVYQSFLRIVRFV